MARRSIPAPPPPNEAPLVAGVRADRLQALQEREAALYAAARPKTRAALEAGQGAWLDGVPMHWMKDWPMPL